MRPKTFTVYVARGLDDTIVDKALTGLTGEQVNALHQEEGAKIGTLLEFDVIPEGAS